MDKIEKRYDELKKLINYYADKYYNDDEPEISDFEYDMLMIELKEIERKYPELITSDSPTQVIVATGKASNHFKEVSHKVSLQSLQDVFDKGEVTSFCDRMKKISEDITFVVETKIDGLSVSLEYEKGIFKRGATRGNGLVGEDVTANLMEIKSIPKKLKDEIDIIVRGEVFMPHDAFYKANELRELNGEKLFSNPRNCAAGSLRQLDPAITRERNLDIFIFNVQDSSNIKFTSHYESLMFLKEQGFNVNPVILKANNSDEVIAAIDKIGEMRGTLSFDIDGAVIKVDDLEKRDEIGVTTKTPKWAVAYKYPPEKKETKLLDIQIQVGRTGALTPLAILKPVRVAGSMVSKTTLHNEDYIKEKDIRIGDYVFIQKAGDVIPELVEVNKDKRTGAEKEFIFPRICPVCGSKASREDDEAVIRCTGIECPAMLFRSLVHFCSKPAMDIDGLGPAIIEQLLDKKMISNIADIYSLTVDDIKVLDKMGEKSAQNLISAIEGSKENSLERLINAFGIRHIGEKTAKILVQKFTTIDAFLSAEEEDFKNVNEIGDVMAKSLKDFFVNHQTVDLISKLTNVGVNMKSNNLQPTDSRFTRNDFCINGHSRKFFER